VDRPPPDAELITRARQGDRDAYEALVQRYQDVALRVAYLITGDFAEAEDATQEAFLKVYAALGRFRLDAPFQPWLLRIVANEARNVRKAAQRRSTLVSRVSFQHPARGHVPSPEGTALANEQRGVLVRALQELREDDRLAISYRYFFDLSEGEMVEALGWSRGTVKSRLSRALGRYRQQLGELALLPVGVYASPHVASDLAALGGAELEHALADFGAHLPAAPPGQALVSAVMGRLHLAVPPQWHPGIPSFALPLTAAGAAALAAVVIIAAPALRSTPSPPATTAAAVVGQPTTPPVAVAAPAPSAGAAAQAGARPAGPTPFPAGGPPVTAGQTYIVLGGDLTDDDRAELLGVFSASAAASVDTLTRDQMADTLRAAGLPVSATDQAISSLAVTCREPGGGVKVRTDNITLVPALVYATTVLVADGADVSLTVAAPSAKPVTGEAALIGAVRVVARCAADKPFDSARLKLAYDQLRATRDLAEVAGDWGKAATVLSRATQGVVTGRAADEAAMRAALSAAASDVGLNLDADLATRLVAVLEPLAGHDYGQYATGYRVEQATANEVRVIPGR